MNCLEFRRHLGGNPSSTQAEFIAHRETCDACTADYLRTQTFEAHLNRALEIPVPAHLVDDILFAQSTQGATQARPFRRGWPVLILAAAASIVVAFVVIHRPIADMPTLAGQVVDHLQIHQLSTVDYGRPIPKSAVMNAFAVNGISLAFVPEGVNYVHQCPAGSHKTVHMVMLEHNNPVSVVYVMDTLSDARVDFTQGKNHVREIPMGKGSLILFSRNDASFAAIEQSWKEAMGESVSSIAMVSGI